MKKTLFKKEHQNDKWRSILTSKQYAVMREKRTEAPFIGKYVHEKRNGIYNCVACGNTLFSSDAKFESRSGWPSFDHALPGSVEFRDDSTYNMLRTEVVCSKCGSHLGHIFNDGPTSTGKRYCINSVCLDFKKL